MTTVGKCTASKEGHKPGDTKAIRTCPVHGTKRVRGSGSPSSVAAIHAPTASRLEPSHHFLEDLSDEGWLDLTREAFGSVEALGGVDNLDAFAYIDEVAARAPRLNAEITLDDLKARIRDGEKVFVGETIVGNLSPAETNGVTFAQCHVRGDVTVGERTVVAGGSISGSIFTPGSQPDDRTAWGTHGNTARAIVSGCVIRGNGNLDASSECMLIGCQVGGDLTLSAGNGLQWAAVRGTTAAGVIFVDDHESVSVDNYEAGNIIAFRGSFSGREAGRYVGLDPDVDDMSDEDFWVGVVSYDDIPSAQVSAASPSEFAMFDRRVDSAARRLRARVDSAALLGQAHVASELAIKEIV